MTAVDQSVKTYEPIAPLDYVPGFAAATPTQIHFPKSWSAKSMLLRLFGCGMVLASTGIWLLSDSGADPELAMMRLGVSVALLFLGLVMLLLKEEVKDPAVVIDTRRCELRLEDMDAHGLPREILRRRFDALGVAVLSRKTLVLRDGDGSVLARIPFGDARSREVLMERLQGHIELQLR